jgi:hypothetical protein
VFVLRSGTDSGDQSFLDKLVAEYHRAEEESVHAVAAGRRIPQPFAFELALHREAGNVPLRVVVTGTWRFYRAKVEAYDVNGSYEFTKGDFKGRLATPPIDRLSTEPGPGWELLDGPPVLVGNVVMIVLFRGNAKEVLSETLGPRSLQAANKAVHPTAAAATVSGRG